MNRRERDLHILVVEDNEADITLIREAISETNSKTRISAVKTGEAALDFLEREAPDLILLDLNLPGKNGHEVLSTVKDQQRLRRIPVIILTSSQSERDVRAAYDSGASIYIRKPRDLDALFDMIGGLQRIFGGYAVLASEVESADRGIRK